MNADELLREMRQAYEKAWAYGHTADESMRQALRVFIENTGGREYWEIAMREIVEDGHRMLPRNIGLLLELANLEGK